MNEYLKKFDTIRFVATWSIFKNFLGIFYFLEFEFEFWIWATGRNQNQSGPVWPVTGKTGPVPVGIFNPAAATAATAFKLLLPSETITLNLNGFLQVCEQFSPAKQSTTSRDKFSKEHRCDLYIFANLDSHAARAQKTTAWVEISSSIAETKTKRN